MSNINIVREIKNNKKKTQNNNEMMRETGWNNRFYLGKITDYNNNNIKKNKTSNNNTNTKNNNNLNGALYNYNYNNINQYPSNKPYPNLDSNLAFLKSQIKARKKVYPNTSRSQNHSKITKGNYSNLNNYNYLPNNNINNNNNNNNNYLNDYNNYDENNNNFYSLETEENSVFSNMSQTEIETYLNIIWDDLGVSPDYKNIFFQTINSLNAQQAKIDFYSLEINNLKIFEDLLDNFSKEMLNREKTLLLIQKLEEVMDKQFYNLNLEIPDNILNDFKKAVNTLRIYTIKCTFIMNDIRELISYNTLNGKFDLDRLNSKYGFDKN